VEGVSQRETWISSEIPGNLGSAFQHSYSPDIIYFSGTFRGSRRPQLDLAIQPNMNPRRLSISEWFSKQPHMSFLNAEATGRLTIGGQPGVFMENSTESGKERNLCLAE